MPQKGGHNAVGRNSFSRSYCGLTPDCSGLRVEYEMRIKRQNLLKESLEGKEVCCSRMWSRAWRFQEADNVRESLYLTLGMLRA